MSLRFLAATFGAAKSSGWAIIPMVTVPGLQVVINAGAQIGNVAISIPQDILSILDPLGQGSTFSQEAPVILTSIYGNGANHLLGTFQAGYGVHAQFRLNAGFWELQVAVTLSAVAPAGGLTMNLSCLIMPPDIGKLIQ